MAGHYLPGDRGEWVWVAVGLMLVAAQFALMGTTSGLTHVNALTLTAVMPMILGLAIPAGLLLLAGPHLVRSPPTPFTWAALIVVGLLLRAVWLGQVAPLDDDFYRYLWDGALLAHGLDPYRFAPGALIQPVDAPAAYQGLAAGRKALLDNINFNDMRTIYPSVAQAAFALAHLLQPFKIDGLRLVFIGAEIATLLLLLAVLRETGRSPFWSALYWWNPFAAVMTVGLAHVDAILPPLVLGALLAHARGRSNWAVFLIGLGAGVKIWPLLLAPIILWPLVRTPRRLIGACVVLGLTLVVAVGPVLWSTLRPGSGLTAYATGWTNNNAFYAWTLVGINKLLGHPQGAEGWLRLALAAATALVALAQAFRGDGSLPSLLQRGLIVAAGVFYLSPAQFPWYAVWFLPLAAARGCWPLLLASALLPFYYLFFPQWPVEQGSLFFYGIAFIHSLPVLLWLLYDWRIGQRQIKQRQTTSNVDRPDARTPGAL